MKLLRKLQFLLVYRLTTPPDDAAVCVLCQLNGNRNLALSLDDMHDHMLSHVDGQEKVVRAGIKARIISP